MMASLRQTLADVAISRPEDPEPAYGTLGAVPLPDEEAAAIAARYGHWESALKPDNPFETWLVEQVAAEAIEIDRLRAQIADRRTLMARRAALRWDDDRRAEAESLGARLGRDPAGIGLRLRATLQGSRWLVGRWRTLDRVLEAGGGWSGAQRSAALDLLGFARDDREGATPADLEPAMLRDRIAAEVARLEAEQATALVELDRAEQTAAARGAGAAIDRALAPLGRQMRAAGRRQEWCLAQFKARRSAPRPAGSNFARPAYLPPTISPREFPAEAPPDHEPMAFTGCRPIPPPPDAPEDAPPTGFDPPTPRPDRRRRPADGFPTPPGRSQPERAPRADRPRGAPPQRKARHAVGAETHRDD